MLGQISQILFGRIYLPSNVVVKVQQLVIMKKRTFSNGHLAKQHKKGAKQSAKKDTINYHLAWVQLRHFFGLIAFHFSFFTSWALLKDSRGLYCLFWHTPDFSSFVSTWKKLSMDVSKIRKVDPIGFTWNFLLPAKKDNLSATFFLKIIMLWNHNAQCCISRKSWTISKHESGPSHFLSFSVKFWFYLT